MHRHRGAMRSRSARSWAATDAAITAGSLPRICGTPIGQASACTRSAAMPSSRKRFSKRARFVFDPISPTNGNPRASASAVMARSSG
jgi:hypothetical protein